MNSLLSSLPADGWQRFLCDALWQSTLIAAAGWFVARCFLRQAAARSWVLLLTLTACVTVPLASLAARANGWGMIAAEKNGADSLPATRAVESSSPSIDRSVAPEPPVHLSQPDMASTEFAGSLPQFSESTIPAPIAAIDSDSPTQSLNVDRTVAPIPNSAAGSTVQSSLAAFSLLDVVRWVGVAWLSLSAILLARLASSILAIRRLLRSAIPSENHELQIATETAANRLGLTRPVRVLYSQKIATPMVLAFGKPVLLVPAHSSTSADHTNRPCDWTATFTHELAHVIRGDGWSRLWAELVSIALPCSPLVWLAKRDFRIACEEACDDWVIATGADPAEFAETLTNWISSPAQPIPLAAIGMSSTKARMSRILSMKEKPMTTLRGSWRLAVIAVALVCISTIAFAQRPSSKSPARTNQKTDSAAPPAAAKAAAPTSDVDQPAANGDIQRQISELEKQAARLQSQIERLRAQSRPPSEKTGRISLPPYIVEPPDVLLIDSLRVIPKAPFKIQPLDVLQIEVVGTKHDQPIKGLFLIEPGGMVNLGPGYGKAKVSGLSLEEAADAITAQLKKTLNNPEVSVTLNESGGQQQISGKHLIGPDGTINLGTYGSVYVAGLTIREAKEAIEKHLTEYLESPLVSVDVSAYNSKVYYVITHGPNGDSVQRFGITGNETVLDAISQVKGLSDLGRKEIWIARPMQSGQDQILKVNWKDITSGANNTNYQVLPGDRIFIERITDESTSEPKDDAQYAVKSAMMALGPAVVVQTIPEAGSAEVDPELSEIKVTFSRTMRDKSWSWCRTAPEAFPEADGEIKYLDDQRTCVMPVKLEPGKTYNVWLNWPEGTAAHNFRDLNGQPAAPYLLVFKTKAAPVSAPMPVTTY
jgi:polysaccharide export outer membrane protein